MLILAARPPTRSAGRRPPPPTSSRETRDGINIADSGTTGNVVEGNYIGTTADGTGPLGNTVDGVLIENSASNNTIGGTTTGAGNVIAFNGGNGVTVGLNVLDAALDNAVLENSIFSNSGLGINVDNTAPQAAPVLTSAVSGGSQTTITGTVTGAPNTIFRIEFFSNPAGTSQGETYLGFLDVTTNGSGSSSFSFAPASPVAPGLNITATATDPNGNTSEFSAAATVLTASQEANTLIQEVNALVLPLSASQARVLKSGLTFLLTLTPYKSVNILKVNGFIASVTLLQRTGILTQAQANPLIQGADSLLVTLNYG